MTQASKQKKDPFSQAVEQLFQATPQGARVTAKVKTDGKVSDVVVFKAKGAK
jgi:hypothetical protein